MPPIPAIKDTSFTFYLDTLNSYLLYGLERPPKALV